MDNDDPSHLRIYLVVLATGFLHVSSGAVMGWSSPILPKLHLSTSEESWVGSLYSLGAAPGPFVITCCLDTIGRKGTIYVLWASFLVSWIILLVSQDIWFIYVARLIGGIGVGGAFAGLPVYIAEVAVTEIRGRLGSISFLLFGVGSTLICAIGPLVTYYTLSLYGLLMAGVFGVLFYFVPESPYYYIKKGRRQEAELALQRLRGYRTRSRLQQELQEIEKAVDQESDLSRAQFWEEMRRPATRRSLVMGLFLVAMQQLTAGGPLNAYCQSIFEGAGLSIPAASVPVINNVLALAFSFVPVLIVNKLLTTKMTIVVSGFVSSLSLLLLGLYFYLLNSGVDMQDYSILSLVFLLSNSLGVAIGVGPLTWPLIAELLPLSVKGLSTGICGCFSSLVGFACLMVFRQLADPFGYSTVLFGFGVLMLLTSVSSIFIVPETSGKSLQEIQEFLGK